MRFHSIWTLKAPVTIQISEFFWIITCVPQRTEKHILIWHNLSSKIRQCEIMTSCEMSEPVLNGRQNTWQRCCKSNTINHSHATISLYNHSEAVRLISISWKLHFHLALLSVWSYNESSWPRHVVQELFSF